MLNLVKIKHTGYKISERSFSLCNTGSLKLINEMQQIIGNTDTVSLLSIKFLYYTISLFDKQLKSNYSFILNQKWPSSNVVSI